MTEDNSANAAAQSQQYVDLRNLAGALAPPGDVWAQFIKGTVVSVQTSVGQATATVQLGGDTTTSIPGVRLLDSYTPVAGDVVQIGKQGQEFFIIGRINKAVPSLAVNGWVTPTLGSGFTGSVNTPMYRAIWDNGDRKIQLRGTISVSGGTTLWTMPVELRPLLFKLVLCGRDVTGGSNVAQIAINTSGTLVLEGRTTGMRDGTATTDIGGSTAASVTRSTGGVLNPIGGYPENGISGTGGAFFGDTSPGHKHGMDHHHNVTISGLSHQHGVDLTPTPVTAPTTIYLDGIEYFV